MAPIQVNIKHAGKTYTLPLDSDLPPAVFKDTIYQATGVPPDRMKVMVKGGVLKDDSVWKKIGPKEGQTFTVIGAAGELPKPPTQSVIFLEDMDDSELAEALAKPVGLTNLGNTCYMNATVQALRAVPELQIALSTASLQSTTPLPGSLRDLYTNMTRTTDSITPMRFLETLRQVNPQFGQQDTTEASAMMGRRMYAQQDAEECYGTIINSLRNVPGLDASGKSVSNGAEASIGRARFIEQYMMGEMRKELKCVENEEEPITVTTEKVLKLQCSISITTNFMLSGIMDSLNSDETVKRSPSLGRDAVYTEKSRLTRLPAYLTIHMARFSWREDIQKKTKIMRRVKFPEEFDALDLVTDELREKLLPASRKLKELEKERGERRKVRKRTKQLDGSAGPSTTVVPPTVDVEMADAVATATATTTATSPEAATGSESKGLDEVEDEIVVRKRENEEFDQLVSPDIKSDIGASTSALYDLVAIIAHKGAAADAGHYIGYVKKSVFYAYSKKRTDGAEAELTTAELDAIEDDEDWYKFDDEKVSLFPKEKLVTLSGGGEDSSAYVLLYKSKTVA